jgi:hypothetical protein
MDKNNIVFVMCSEVYCRVEFMYILILTLSILFVIALLMKWKSHIKLSYMKITLSYMLILLVTYFIWHFTVAYLVYFD